jgi:thymidine kinase
MFAGKTSEALRVIRMNRSIHRRVFVCTHSSDQRYGTGCVSSHDQSTIPAVLTDDLLSLAAHLDFQNADVVVLEEAQFFRDLQAFALLCVQRLGKELHVFGLDGDYQQRPMGDILQLCPLADTFRKISALCMYCQNGTPAPFTITTKQMPTSGILVGGADVYAAVCRKHFLSR